MIEDVRRPGQPAEIRLLDYDGSLLGAAPMGVEKARQAMRLMLLSRATDERFIKLQRMGRVGIYGPVHGQEASVIGSAMALSPARDWMVPASREHLAMHLHGLPLATLYAAYLGRIDHTAVPAGVRLLPRQQAIGAQLPHATGLAWALKLQRLPGAVMVYFGEGAASEGDFHEAANLAGVIGAPLVMVLINNQYAISTPAHRQSAAPNLAARAIGYGFPGVLVDGNDLFAVHAAATEAVERAVAGQGPTLIECRTYRMGFHNTSDNPREYRADSEVEDAAERDPIDRLRLWLTGEGAWSPQVEAEMVAQVTTEIDAAIAEVNTQARPGAEAIFNHVYAELPSRIEQQRRDTVALNEDG